MWHKLKQPIMRQYFLDKTLSLWMDYLESFLEDALFVPIGFFDDLSNTVLGNLEKLLVRRENAYSEKDFA